MLPLFIIQKGESQRASVPAQLSVDGSGTHRMANRGFCVSLEASIRGTLIAGQSCLGKSFCLVGEGYLRSIQEKFKWEENYIRTTMCWLLQKLEWLELNGHWSWTFAATASPVFCVLNTISESKHCHQGLKQPSTIGNWNLNGPKKGKILRR